MSTRPDAIQPEINIVVHVRATAKEGKLAEFEAAVIKLRDVVVKRPGVLFHKMAKFGNEFVVFECFESQKVLGEYMNSEEFKTFNKEIEQLREGPPTALFFEAIPGGK